MKTNQDVVIIGAGPTGLYAAFLAAEKKLHVAVVDALPEVGGQLTALYPQKYIYDVAGYPRATAANLAAELKKQVLQHEVPIHYDFRVNSLIQEVTGEYKVGADDGRYLHSRYVIVAAGAGMISPRKLELEDAERFLGRGFEYVVRNTEDYRDKRVLIIGGGDTALDWALFFTAMAREVSLIHRTSKFVGFEGTLRQLQKASCTIYTDSKLTSMFGTDRVEGAEITNTKESWTKTLELDCILGCIGFTPKLGFVKECGFEIAEGSIRTDRNMLTNLPGVYAVGDISNHAGRIKLISTGFGNVQIAIDHILRSESEQIEDRRNLELEQL